MQVGNAMEPIFPLLRRDTSVAVQYIQVMSFQFQFLLKLLWVLCVMQCLYQAGVLAGLAEHC